MAGGLNTLFVFVWGLHVLPVSHKFTLGYAGCFLQPYDKVRLARLSWLLCEHVPCSPALCNLG